MGFTVSWVVVGREAEAEKSHRGSRKEKLTKA